MPDETRRRSAGPNRRGGFSMIETLFVIIILGIVAGFAFPAVEQGVARRLGHDRVFAVTGQTYPRKADAQVLDVLSGIAQSTAKFAGDLRLLQHEGELLEPFEADQIGSSAMAYKRNPMRAERINALARHVITLQQNTAHTAAAQWLERTLDDSANRRLTLPEAFLAIDAILLLAGNIASGLEVRGHTIAQHVAAKRYLCQAEAGYFDCLSEESVCSLKVQGGPFDAAEAAAFLARPYASEAVALRRWDEEAKDPEMRTPALEDFRPVLERAERHAAS